MFEIKKVRADFPMLRGEHKMQGHDLIFLDNASTTFKPDCVLEAINRYYTEETANSHRGDYDLCNKVDKEVAIVREKVASFLHCDSKEVVFTAGDTASLNLVAFGFACKFLKEGDEILLTLAEHASNVLPWFRVSELTGAKIRYIPLEGTGRITAGAVASVINEHTKIISIAHVGNVLGYVAPIKEIAKLAHEVGAYLIVDGAQSVPHMVTNVRDLDCDFLTFSGHKLCAPTGTGILYGKYDLLCDMDPYYVGGGMNVRFSSNGSAEYLLPPARFEAGTMNVAGIYGLGAAIDYLMGLGMDNISAREKELKEYAVKKFSELPNVTLYNADSEAGIIDFNINGVFAQDAATFLNSKGIACRSGLHCAKMLPEQTGEPATVRASFYFYTTKEDIDLLVDAVAKGGDFLDAYF